MVTVYHLERSRSDRVIWLLEELGAPYEIVRFARDPETMRAPAAMREVHPLAKSPTIRDGDALLVESGAIVEHLLERYGDGALAPALGSPERARYLQWLHFSEGSAMANLVMLMFLDGTIPGTEPGPMAEAVRLGIDEQLAWIESELHGCEYLAGDAFSAADLMMAYPIQIAESRGMLDDKPALSAWLERVTARPAHAKAAEIAQS